MNSHHHHTAAPVDRRTDSNSSSNNKQQSRRSGDSCEIVFEQDQKRSPSAVSNRRACMLECLFVERFKLNRQFAKIASQPLRVTEVGQQQQQHAMGEKRSKFMVQS